MIYFFLALIILLYGSIISLLIYNIHKISFINKIVNKKLSWLLSIVPIIILFLFFNLINSFVIIVHILLFLGLNTIVIKLLKRKISFDIKGLFTIIITIIYLTIGAYLDYHVFETKYDINTNKNLGQQSFKIIQISDSHIGTTFDSNGFKKHLEKIQKIEADIVVITGDFVDDDTKKDDMIKSCNALSLLKPKYGIYFIYGNHDKGYYNNRNFTKDDLENELEKNNVIILKDDVKNINDNIYIIGRKDKSENRKSIQELINNIPKDKYIIDLNHQPNDYQNEMNNVDLVLSGHTHGGQLFPLGIIGRMIGSNDQTYGIEKKGNTYFIVNSGISNWALSFKTGTKSEYGIIEIKKL